MATHQITASQIRPGSTIILRGKIEYARVRSLMGPEDIDKLNETRRANRKPVHRSTRWTATSRSRGSRYPTLKSSSRAPMASLIWKSTTSMSVCSRLPISPN